MEGSDDEDTTKEKKRGLRRREPDDTEIDEDKQRIENKKDQYEEEEWETDECRIKDVVVVMKMAWKRRKEIERQDGEGEMGVETQRIEKILYIAQ